LGELFDVDYEAMPLMRLYRSSDLLVRHRAAIESALFNRINELFSQPATVTLYDQTNIYFEGAVAANAKARRGHSKEKRRDCPLKRTAERSMSARPPLRNPNWPGCMNCWGCPRRPVVSAKWCSEPPTTRL